MGKKLQPRDTKLLAALVLASIFAITACWFGSRQFERHLLTVEAEEAAVHWATFLEKHFTDLEGLLRTGAVTPDDRALLDFASEAGRMFRYKMFNQDGDIVVASRPSDLGRTNTKPYFAEVVQRGGTFVKIEEEEDFGTAMTTVSEAYVPFMENGEFKGAIEVYVDATAHAQSLREKSTQALLALIAFLLTLGGVFSVFLAYNIRDRNRDFQKVKTAHEASSRAAAEVKVLNAELEQRVAERTHELNNANQKITKFNEELEQRIVERTAELEETQKELLQKERLATLGQLTGTVSHELRNPLAAIRNSIFMIGEKTQDSDLGLDRLLARTERNISRCDRIVCELLDYTRTNTLEAKSEVLDSWLEGALGEQKTPSAITLRKELKVPGLELKFDPERLRRAVINVFDNACQAMTEAAKGAPGERELSLTVQTTSCEDRAQMRFTDTGPGMTPEVLNRIFEPLYSTKAFGVGLGMPIVKQIMEQQGGGIEVSSDPGHGTTVVLWLPIQRKQEEAA